MRKTSQRQLILAVLQETDTHPTAEWVYEEARKVMPGIGIATVYRNLKALADAGEVQRITSSGNVERFDGRLDEHWHLQCECCGKIRDLDPVEGKGIREIQDLICSTFGVKDRNVKIRRTILQGICNDCLAAGHADTGM